MSRKLVYRIIFSNLDEIYDIYARKISESEMFGFLEVEEFIFGENTSLVVDPSEERLKVEFNHVKRSYIPMHSVIRIDEVNKQGTGTIRDKGHEDSKVSIFPTRDKR